MAMTLTGSRPSFRRRQYVIDKPTQVGAAAQLLTGLGGVALLCAAALYVFLGGQAVPGLDPLRRFLLIANATYFVLAAGILTLLTLLLTHRFAGPAYVMRIAIQGMLQGDFGRRLKLRSKDYHQDLATDLVTFREHLIRHDEDHARQIDEIQDALQRKSVEEAKRLLIRLKDDRIVRPETLVKPTVEAPDEATDEPKAPSEPASEESTKVPASVA